MPPIIPVDTIKASSPNPTEPQTDHSCPCCGGRMIIIERFERGARPHYGSRQDRHLVIAALLMNKHYQTHSYSCAARHTQGRIHPLNSQPALLTISPHKLQRVHSHQLPHPPGAAKSFLHPSPSHLGTSARAPKSP